jgi:hypothetical protein
MLAKNRQRPEGAQPATPSRKRTETPAVAAGRDMRLGLPRSTYAGADSLGRCSTRLRIWGLGVRITAGAPLISMGYGKPDLTEIVEMFAGVSAGVTNGVGAACAMLCRGRLI